MAASEFSSPFNQKNIKFPKFVTPPSEYFSFSYNSSNQNSFQLPKRRQHTKNPITPNSLFISDEIQLLSENFLSTQFPFDLSQSEEISCRNDSGNFMRSLKNFELWALESKWKSRFCLLFMGKFCSITILFLQCTILQPNFHQAFWLEMWFSTGISISVWVWLGPKNCFRGNIVWPICNRKFWVAINTWGFSRIRFCLIDPSRAI